VPLEAARLQTACMLGSHIVQLAVTGTDTRTILDFWRRSERERELKREFLVPSEKVI